MRSGIDWSRAAHAADTLVVFMCAETISSIAVDLIANGRKPSTPIAIIRWGTYEHQEVYTGTLEHLASQDEREALELRTRIAPPAIAIIGEVVSLKEKLHWFGRPAFDIAQVEAVEA